MGGLQQKLKLLGIASLDEEAVGIMALGQRDQTGSDASFPETS